MITSPDATPVIREASQPVPAPYSSNARCGIWLASGSWKGWTLRGVERAGSGLRLRHPKSGAATGSATSVVVESGHPFTNVVASWNADTPHGSWVRTSVRARVGEHWTRWYAMGAWGGGGTGASVKSRADADGRVEVDVLHLKRGASACQLRVRLEGADDAVPVLQLASLCWSNPHASAPPPPPVHAGWDRVLDVPRYSQMVQDPSLAWHICSPTSLAMVLGYCGQTLQPMEVAAGVKDHRADMYGNWPMNTAFAGSRGCPAYVARFWCIEQLQNEIASGRPVEASIRFRKGQLPGAPIPSSGGHLIVVVGFTPQGDVVVNDPAAKNESEVRRVYRRRDFQRVWLEGSGGVVYLIAPPTAPVDL